MVVSDSSLYNGMKASTHHDHSLFEGQPQSQVSIEMWITELQAFDGRIVGRLAGTGYVVDIHSERVADPMGEER